MSLTHKDGEVNGIPPARAATGHNLPKKPARGREFSFTFG